MRQPTLKLAWIYPDELSDNGDQGNLLALSRRAELRGIKTKLLPLKPGERLNPGEHDLFYFGSGLARLARLREDFFQTKLESLILDLESGRACFSLEAGLYLLGRGGDQPETGEFSGAGWLDLTFSLGKPRASGPILLKSGMEEKGGLVVGFENQRTAVRLGPGLEPLGQVLRGFGNRDRREGVRTQTLIGTRLGGPVLTLNPHLADLVLRLGLKTRYPDFELAKREDELEDRVFDEACLGFNRRFLKRFY